MVDGEDDGKYPITEDTEVGTFSFLGNRYGVVLYGTKIYLDDDRSKRNEKKITLEEKQ